MTTARSTRATIRITLALAAGLASADAHAQRRRPPPPVAPVAPPPAPPAPPALPPQVIEARQHFDLGQALYQRRNYEAALLEYRRAHALLDGHASRYTVLFNIGQCHQQLQQYDLALEFFRQYLRDGAERVQDRAAVENTVEMLEGLLATVEISSNVPAEVWVDSRSVGRSPGSLRVSAGRHLIELQARGYLPSRQSAQLAPRESARLRFTLDLVGRSRGVHPAVFGVVASVSVASAVTGAVFGMMALGLRDQTRALQMDPVGQWDVSTQLDERGAQVRRNALIADVFFGAAGAAAIGATVLAFVTDWRGAPRAEAPRPDASRARPRRPAWAALPTAGGLVVGRAW